MAMGTAMGTVGSVCAAEARPGLHVEGGGPGRVHTLPFVPTVYCCASLPSHAKRF